MSSAQIKDRFFFCCCQAGAEQACKADVRSRYPFLRFAFSRSGFLTFKVDPSTELPEKFSLTGTFVRSSGRTLAKLQRPAESQPVLREIFQSQTYAAIHVWHRDTGRLYENPLECVDSDAVREARQFVTSAMDPENLGSIASRLQAVVDYDQRVLDVILVDENLWVLGEHWSTTVAGRWPGGIPVIEAPPGMISRAYLKTREAIEWSRMPMTPGDQCVEIGAAPGGSCQALLELGLRVIAIDPAELDPIVAQNPRVIYLRCRSREVKRSLLKNARWLLADLNVAPNYTLAAVSDLVSNSRLQIQGLLLTLKLMQWELAGKIPEYVQSIKELGFRYVRTRQLANNRREFCLAALRDKSQRSD